MRSTVSDILLFRKCPRAWWYSQKYVPRLVAAPLERGNAVHGEVKDFLSVYLGSSPTGDLGQSKLLPAKIRKEIKEAFEKYRIIAIEKGFEFDFRGHTILGRPDGVLKQVLTGDHALWQVKTSTRNCSWHPEIVRISPHEAIYAEAIQHFTGSTCNSSIVMQYVFREKKDPEVIITNQVHDLDMRGLILDGITDTLDKMEAYAEEIPPMHTNSCYDWFTGSKCAYLNLCHHGLESDYTAPIDRYPEFNKQYQDTKGSRGPSQGDSGGNPPSPEGFESTSNS